MGRPPNDLKGKRIGMLTVLERVENDHNGKPMWLCLCDCGNEKVISSSALTNGVKSCGCYRRDWARDTHIKHGFTSHNEKKERLFSVWWRMQQRCNDPHTPHYKNYGGRGITVCEAWHNYGVFREWAYAHGFIEDAKGNQCSIDRIDTNGNYEPSNCRWVTQKQQARNMRTNHLVTLDGRTACVAEWAEDYGIKYSTLLSRLNRAKKKGLSETEVLRGFIYG